MFESFTASYYEWILGNCPTFTPWAKNNPFSVMENLSVKKKIQFNMTWRKRRNTNDAIIYGAPVSIKTFSFPRNH
jgi:hypothetical protein